MTFYKPIYVICLSRVKTERLPNGYQALTSLLPQAFDRIIIIPVKICIHLFGLLIFQLLFKRINLKQRQKKCFSYLKVSPIFGRHLIVMLIIVHLLIGFRRLREVDYYRDDPIVLRLLGLRRLPDVSTISGALSRMEKDGVENVRQLSRSMVIEGLQRERLSRLTLDFDGSVQSTKGHAGVPPSVSIRPRKASGVTILCFVPWPKPDNFSTFTIVPAMSMIPMVPNNSCSTVYQKLKHSYQVPCWNHV